MVPGDGTIERAQVTQLFEQLFDLPPGVVSTGEAHTTTRAPPENTDYGWLDNMAEWTPATRLHGQHIWQDFMV